MIWEYLTKREDMYLASWELDKYGKEGWELVTHSIISVGFGRDHYYTFKRPKP